MAETTLPKGVLAMGATAMVVGFGGLAIDVWGLALQTAVQGAPNLIAVVECAVPLACLLAGAGLMSHTRWAPALLMHYVVLAMSFWVFRLVDFLFTSTTFLASTSAAEMALSRGARLETVLMGCFDILWCIQVAVWIALGSSRYSHR